MTEQAIFKLLLLTPLCIATLWFITDDLRNAKFYKAQAEHRAEHERQRIKTSRMRTRRFLGLPPEE